MKNIQLLALFIAVATVSAVSAGWIDDNGIYHSTPLHMTNNIEDTTYTTGQVIDDTTNTTLEAPRETTGGLFGGRKRRQERRYVRHQYRDQNE